MFVRRIKGAVDRIRATAAICEFSAFIYIFDIYLLLNSWHYYQRNNTLYDSFMTAIRGGFNVYMLLSEYRI